MAQTDTRPTHQRRQIKALAGCGVSETEIAAMVEIYAKTLRKHYRHELGHGHSKANAKVAENLYRNATGEGRETVIVVISSSRPGQAGRRRYSASTSPNRPGNQSE